MGAIDKYALLEIPKAVDLAGLSLRYKASLQLAYPEDSLSTAISILKKGVALPHALKASLRSSAQFLNVTDHEFFYLYATYEQQTATNNKQTKFSNIFSTEHQRLRHKTLLTIRRKLAVLELLCAAGSLLQTDLLNQCPLYFKQNEVLDLLIGGLLAESSKTSAVELIRNITPRQRKSTAKEHAKLRIEVKRIRAKLDYLNYPMTDEDEVKATKKWLTSKYPNVLIQHGKRVSHQAQAIDAVAAVHGVDSRYLQNSLSELNTHMKGEKGKPTSHALVVEGLYNRWWDAFEKSRKRLPSTSHWAGIESFTWKQLIQTK